MDKIKARMIGEEVKAALETIGAKHGLKLEARGGTFTDTEFSPKYTFKESTINGIDAAQHEWNQYCGVFGFTPEEFGQVVRWMDGDYKITGLDLKRRTKPVRIQRMKDGKGFVSATEPVRRSLDWAKKVATVQTPNAAVR